MALSSAALILLAPLAQAQSIGEKTGVNSTLGISPTTQDFVTEAANSDMLELAAAKIAPEPGGAPLALDNMGQCGGRSALARRIRAILLVCR